MSAATHSLFGDELSRVKWDRSDEGIRIVANLTKEFAGLGSHVIVMIDGLKLESQDPSDSLEQNCYCNGWHTALGRILALSWGPREKITDAGRISPGNFHDSKPVL